MGRRYPCGELASAARIAVRTSATDHSAVRDMTGGMGRLWSLARTDYQAWPVPQCGHATEVDTAAWKTMPQAQLYWALSIGPPDSRARRSCGWSSTSSGAGAGAVRGSG